MQMQNKIYQNILSSFLIQPMNLSMPLLRRS